MQYVDSSTYVFSRGAGFEVLVAASNGFGVPDREGYSVEVNLGPEAPIGAGYYNAYDPADTLVVLDQEVSIQFGQGLPPKVYVRLTI